MLSMHKNKQKELKKKYKRFRNCLLTFWIMCNIIFAILIEQYASKVTRSTMVINGKREKVLTNDPINFLLVFALYLAAIVTYKVLFAIMHITKRKFLSLCSKHYRVHKFDLEQEVKKMKAEMVDWRMSMPDSDAH